MPQRRQPPPQIHPIELASRTNGKRVVRYQLTVDARIVDAKRKQIRRSYTTEREARDELAKIRGELVKGIYARPRSASVAAVVTRGVNGRTGRQATAMPGNRDYTRAVIDALGDLPVQELTKARVGQLLSQLESGAAPGKKRLAFGLRACRYAFATLRAVVLEKRARNSSRPWPSINGAPLAAEGW